MTATVLAAMVIDGAVALDDHIGRWIDAGGNGGVTPRGAGDPHRGACPPADAVLRFASTDLLLSVAVFPSGEIGGLTVTAVGASLPW